MPKKYITIKNKKLKICCSNGIGACSSQISGAEFDGWKVILGTWPDKKLQIKGFGTKI